MGAIALKVPETLRARIREYTPDQPRDELGRWTDVGGTIAAGPSGETALRALQGEIERAPGWSAAGQEMAVNAVKAARREGNLLVVARDKDGNVLGAAAYQATREFKMVYISWMGTSGQVRGTGTQLVMDIAQEAISRQYGLIAEPATDQAYQFFLKLGMHEYPKAESFLYLTPKEVRALVKTTESHQLADDDAHALLREYSPDQPRDPEGKWTGDGPMAIIKPALHRKSWDTVHSEVGVRIATDHPTWSVAKVMAEMTKANMELGHYAKLYWATRQGAPKKVLDQLHADAKANQGIKEAFHETVLQEYSPDQPRDERGRWSADGGEFTTPGRSFTDEKNRTADLYEKGNWKAADITVEPTAVIFYHEDGDLIVAGGSEGFHDHSDLIAAVGMKPSYEDHGVHMAWEGKPFGKDPSAFAFTSYTSGGRGREHEIEILGDFLNHYVKTGGDPKTGVYRGSTRIGTVGKLIGRSKESFRETILQEYSPDQPRDEQGKWTAGSLEQYHSQELAKDFRQAAPQGYIRTPKVEIRADPGDRKLIVTGFKNANHAVAFEELVSKRGFNAQWTPVWQRTHVVVIWEKSAMETQIGKRKTTTEALITDHYVMLREYDPDQPRDDHGRWTADGDGDIVHTDDVDVALKALADGKRVEFSQARTVSTLLNRLSDIAKDAASKGPNAPKYDLCKVSVAGTNLFCAETMGIPRLAMPQLSGKPLPGSPADALPRDQFGQVNIAPRFVEYLRDQGANMRYDIEGAEYLKATQRELIGVKVGQMVNAIRTGTVGGATMGPLIVNRDNYIVDGHHRWAATVGLEYERPGRQYPMRIIRVDMGIIELVAQARKFAAQQGLPSVSGGLKIGEAMLMEYSPDQPRDEQGRWTDTGAGGLPPIGGYAPRVNSAPASAQERQGTRPMPGLCYEAAGRYAAIDAGLRQGVTVVHGTIEVRDPVTNTRFTMGHAWVELPGNRVYDGAQGEFFDKDDYYEKLSVKVERAYSAVNAAKLMYRNRDFGPWHQTRGVTRDPKGKVAVH